MRHLGLLRFHGADALSFLQGQISNDTRKLAAGPLLAAYSTPQGRVLAVLQLVAYPQGALAIAPRELVQPIQERLKKFVMRAKVKIDDVSNEFSVLGYHSTRGLASAGTAAPSAEAILASPEAVVASHDVMVASPVAGDSSRSWVLGPSALLSARGLDGDPQCADQIQNAWRLADIRAGLPQIYAATSELFVAQMLNLDLLDGISFSKGCYTGQEIIARAQHLGRIKRRMVQLKLASGNWTVGQVVPLTEGHSGRLIETAHADDGVEALAVPI
jgi:folate-binding protein YgfZ